jgi:hypothetical protein
MNERITVDVLLDEAVLPNRLRDAEAVCRAYGRLIGYRQEGAPSNVQAAASSQVAILWERWERRWGQA